MHFQQLTGESHQRHARISILVVDDDIFIVNVELPAQKPRGLAGQLLLRQFPKLPLPERVAQQDEHHLGDNHVEAARVKIAQIVETFQEPVPFLDLGAQFIVLLGPERIGEISRVH